MASYQECERALHDLAAALSGVDPQVRQRKMPRRTVSFTVPDLGVTWHGVLDEHGMHDFTTEPGDRAQLRVESSSDALVELAGSPKDFLASWLRGRVKVKASPRDLLELRRLL